MSHYWSSISVYPVRVIAQDINGLNSSWSLPLNITVSQANQSVSPVIAIKLSGILIVNNSIVFDASESYIADGVIVSYHWDFGDGENSSDISPTHVYEHPGEYKITLLITDNNGNTYSKIISSNITSAIEKSEVIKEEQQVIPFFDLFSVIILFVILLIVILIIIFRNNIKELVFDNINSYLVNRKISRIDRRIEKLEAELKENNKKKNVGKTVSQEPLLIDNIPDLFGVENEATKDADFNIESSDEFDKFHTGEKIEKIFENRKKPDKAYSFMSDGESYKYIRTRIDDIISAFNRKDLNLFDLDDEDDNDYSDEMDINRLVDRIIKEKEEEKIDIILNDN